MDESEAPPKPRWSRRRKALMGVSSSLVLVVAALWTFRAPLIDRYAQDVLSDKGVPARYEIDQIGLKTQRLTNVVIGNPKSPDLTARVVELDLRYGWSGPEVAAIRATGVRARGRVAKDGAISFGVLDKLRDPTSREPFVLPDIRASFDDVRLDLATPWGAVKARIDGAGRLTDGFTGRAAATSTAIQIDPCTVDRLALSGPVTSQSGRMTFDIMGGANVADCGDTARVNAPRIATKMTLRSDFKQWDGDVTLFASGAKGPGVTLTSPRFRTSIFGTAEATRFDWRFTPTTTRLAGGLSGRLGAVGKAGVGDAGLTYSAKAKLTGASLDAEGRRAIFDAGVAANDLPIRKIVADLTGRLAKAAENFDLQFDVVQQEKGPPILKGLSALSASGVRMSMGADDRVTLAPLGVDGTVTLEGAGVPPTMLKGRWGSRGGNAALILSPMNAEGERLALTPVQIEGGGARPIRFATLATVSGPIPGGRVDNLVVPLRGGVGGGAVSIDSGCLALRWASLSVQGVILDPATVNVCSARGVPIFKSGTGVARLAVAGGRVTGRTGSSPLNARWRDAFVQVVGNKAAVNGITLDIGPAESQSNFTLERLDIDFARGGLGGTLSGGAATIGNIPLVMSDIAGAWRRTDAGIVFNGGMNLTDEASPARFEPLRSDSVMLRYFEGVVTGTAGLREQKSGTEVVAVDLQHVFEGSSGYANLKVDGLRFAEEGFQPRQLTGLALGVVTDVNARISGTGRIDWREGEVTSGGRFTTEQADLAAAFGIVRGLSTELNFSDLLGLKSDAVQIMGIAEINPGIPVRDGVIKYRLLGDSRVEILEGRWPFAGGELILDPTVLDFGPDMPRRMNFRVVGLDAALFLQEFNFENINATGIFDGQLPLVFDGLGARIENGRLEARAPGGSLAYVGELSNRNLTVMANFAFDALKSLKYETLTINLNGSLTGELVTDVRFTGLNQGEGAKRNFITREIAKLPLIFNVRINAPFRQLISSAKSLYDPTMLIEQNLEALQRYEAEQRAKARGEETPMNPDQRAVQPGASEDVP